MDSFRTAQSPGGPEGGDPYQGVPLCAPLQRGIFSFCCLSLSTKPQMRCEQGLGNKAGSVSAGAALSGLLLNTHLGLRGSGGVAGGSGG